MRVNLYDYEEYTDWNDYWQEWRHIDTGESIFFLGKRVRCWECGGTGFEDDFFADEDEDDEEIRSECPNCEGVGRRTEYDYNDAFTYEEMVALKTQSYNLLRRYGTLKPKSIADYWDNPPKIVC